MNIDNRQMLPIGTMLKGGEYCVKRYIASGGFGNTYEIEHVRLGKHLALKEFFMRGINVREGTRVSVSQEDNARLMTKCEKSSTKKPNAWLYWKIRTSWKLMTSSRRTKRHTT